MKEYRIFKAAGALAAMISIYKALSGDIAIIDFIILALLSGVFFTIGHEMKHKHKRTNAPVEISFPARELHRGVLIRSENPA